MKSSNVGLAVTMMALGAGVGLAEEGYRKPVPRNPQGIEYTYDEERDPVCLLNDVDTAVVEREEDRAAGFEKGRYYPPESVATALHAVQTTKMFFKAHPCGFLGLPRLEAAEKRIAETLSESLDKDSFVLMGNLKSFEKHLDDLEAKVAAARDAGWPPGAKDTLAATYVGYYDGQGAELMRLYIGLTRAAFSAEAADDSRPWVEGAVCEAGPVIVRLVPRVAGLEKELGLGATSGSPLDALSRPVAPKPRGTALDSFDAEESARQAAKAFR